MDIAAKLRHIASRKAADKRLVEDIRAGKYDGVMSASEYFKDILEPRERTPTAEPCPAPCAAPASLPEDLRAIQGESGRTLVRELNLLPGEAGRYCIGTTDFWTSVPAEVPAEIIAEICATTQDAQAIPLSRVAFIDTETTGLAGGTGTVAFLIGIGWWEGEGAARRFRMDQFLIEDFEHERDMLERLAARLAGFDALCTYNGKCFDVPLLRTRAIMNRIPPRILNHRQADLLHLSRRLWKGLLPNVSLKTVEREILGIDRGPDIDGSLIPAVFADFARTGSSPLLAEVLHHNVQDVATLAVLLAHVGALLGDAVGCGLAKGWREFAGLSRWREKQGNHEAAVSLLDRAIERCNEESHEQDLMARQALLLKKLQRWDEARELWSTLTRLPARRAMPAWLELLKHRERVAKDPAGALALARECRERLAMERELARLRSAKDHETLATFHEDLAKRIERLQARTNRLASRAPRP